MKNRRRFALYLEKLEDRTLLDAAVFPTPLELAETQPFTLTEVVARVRSSSPVQDVLASRPGLAALIDPARSGILFGRDGIYTVQVGLRGGADPRAVVRSLDALPFVEWASPNFIYHKEGTATPDPRDYTPNDPRFSAQYHHPLMQNTVAWDYYAFGSTNVVVAVTDDGVDTYHQDLYENIWINQAEIPATRLINLADLDGDGRISFRDLNDPVNQGPFKANDTNSDGRIDARDVLALMQMSGGQDQGGGGWANRLDDGENTYVDDLVGWDTNESDNDPHPGTSTHGTHVAGIIAARTDNGIGVAGTAGDVTIMPLRWTGRNAWTSTVIANSYAYAADNGARIISTSYTVDQFVDDPIFRSGLEYMYSLGVLHINSAGNQGQANRARLRLDTTLYVANTDSNDRKNSSSNWGWGMDISAPGTNILSTTVNNSYGQLTGTSMSAPNVAGVAALLWSAVPSWTREELVAQLLGTTDDIDAINPQWAGQLGTGRVNAGRAVLDFIAAPRFRGTVGLPAEGGSTSSLRMFQVDLRNAFMQSAIHDMANWEMREAGADGQFDTADDVLRPMTLSMTIGNTYLVGTNRLYFTLASNLPAGSYRFRAVSGGLMDPFWQPLDGNGDGTGGDHFDRHFFVVGAAPGGGSGGGDALLIDALLDEPLPFEFIQEPQRLDDALPDVLTMVPVFVRPAGNERMVEIRQVADPQELAAPPLDITIRIE